MTQPPLLQMRKISKSYEGTQALRAVDFSAEAGEVHAIVGENGAGKSTLVKILSGAVKRDAGDILIDNRPVELENPFQAHHLESAQVSGVQPDPHTSTEENILMGHLLDGPQVLGIDWASAHRQCRKPDGYRFSANRKRPSRGWRLHQQMVGSPKRC